MQVCNDPLTSKLHVPGADAALVDHCVPACVQLGGKLAALTTLLQRLPGKGAMLLMCAHALLPQQGVSCGALRSFNTTPLTNMCAKAAQMCQNESFTACRSQTAAVLHHDNNAGQRGGGAGVARLEVGAPGRHHKSVRAWRFAAVLQH